MVDVTLTDRDVRSLRDRGMSAEEARRQLSLLASPHHHVELVRACTVGDGIERLGDEEFEPLRALHAEAAIAGRFTKFVPASGAASRMFQSLVRFFSGSCAATSWDGLRAQARDGNGEAAEVRDLVTRLPSFAFYEDLERQLRSRGLAPDALVAAADHRSILEGLLAPEALDYQSKPKGLIPFHRYPSGSRTAFEEHLVEADDYVRDGDGICRLHFTVARRHREAFEQVARDAPARLGLRGDRFDISYSVQKHSTDTLSLDDRGRPVRDRDGGLVFRPGGHGALIDNLAELQADLVFVKNIDNVQPDRLKVATSHWKRVLAGLLLRLQRETFRLLDELSRPRPPGETIERARSFLRDRLHAEVPSAGPAGFQCERARLIATLNRPLRVCGVVPNTGEPGGGPFWVQDRDGRVGLQIVETSQIDPRNERQQGILRAATHFNPVDLVCGVRDYRGRPFDLRRFIDPDAVIVTRKSDRGHEIRVLERPGLWNGAMADWNTVFVEVPLATFTPVKTVSDLLREEHQAS